ncbi:MAG: hypothetical protein K9H79_01290 [Chitinophagaceae bacterium]|nr:hypothetical protein [Chitinophagaceae bacterium]MCF8421505.1 hypothetical protein [Chitinophagaceae bacterium]
MKKSSLFTTILLLSLLFLNACSKNDQLGPVNDPPEQNLPAPLSAPLFDELNETIARFDPLYLQVVYKDKRSKETINEEAARLLIAINENPNSLVIQKELTDLYHFKNFADLQKASNIISNNSSELKKTFLGKDTVLSKTKMNQLNAARNTFLKNKITTLEKASQRTSSGLWTDNAEWILAQFHYYSQIANLEVGLDGMDDLGGAGAGPGCTESCCFEYQSCMTNANSKLIQYLWTYVGGGIIGGAGAGFALGTYVPGIGNLIGATGGAFYGGYLIGTTGYIVAATIYMNDQKVCALNYKACIQRKNGN